MGAPAAEDTASAVPQHQPAVQRQLERPRALPQRQQQPLRVPQEGVGVHVRPLQRDQELHGEHGQVGAGHRGEVFRLDVRAAEQAEQEVVHAHLPDGDHRHLHGRGRADIRHHRR